MQAMDDQISSELHSLLLRSVCTYYFHREPGGFAGLQHLGLLVRWQQYHSWELSSVNISEEDQEVQELLLGVHVRQGQMEFGKRTADNYCWDWAGRENVTVTRQACQIVFLRDTSTYVISR